MLTSCVLDPRTPADDKPLTVGPRPTAAPLAVIDLKHVVALIRKKVKTSDAPLGKRGVLLFPSAVVSKNHIMRRITSVQNPNLDAALVIKREVATNVANYRPGVRGV